MDEEEIKKIIKRGNFYGFDFTSNKDTLFMSESSDIIIQEGNRTLFFIKVKEHIEELEEIINC